MPHLRRLSGTLYLDVVFFVALLSTALALGAALAHVLELPNKMALTRDEYFVVQSIYAGWNRLAYLLLVELISMLAVITVVCKPPARECSYR
jgi:hypothetical protein